jgi:SAM-dependent methyltransferase
MTEYYNYFAYLKSRSQLGWLYRKFWLYPTLCRNLNGRTLDIGCGIGDFLNYRKETVGVDINPLLVEWCRNRGFEVSLLDSNRLPFANASFESSLLDNVLEHILDPTPLLVEIRRVLKYRGRLIVGIPGRRGYASDPDHKVFYDTENLISILAKENFVVQQFFYMPFKANYLSNYIRQYCTYGVFLRE